MIRRLSAYLARHIAGTVTHVKTDERIAALTFDDGPHPRYTIDLLDILARYNAHATFFCVGERAAQYASIIEKIVQDGHEVANHSWDHTPFSQLSSRQRWNQLTSCYHVLAPSGKKYFRPPNGDQTIAARIDAWLLGYTVVTWSVVGRDWSGEDAHTISDRVIRSIRPGSIVLLHDALYTGLRKQYFARDATLQAVEVILDQLSPEYEFVALSELFRRGVPQKANWYRQVNSETLTRLKKYNSLSDQ